MEKRCGKCRCLKPYSEFYKDRSQPMNLSCYCKECKASQNKSWRLENPEKFKESSDASRFRNRMKRYGLTEDEFNELWDQQNGICAICSIDLDGGKHTHIDHDHMNGRVRGLLCSGCNKGLGMFKEDIVALKNAIQYLRQ